MYCKIRRRYNRERALQHKIDLPVCPSLRLKKEPFGLLPGRELGGVFGPEDLLAGRVREAHRGLLLLELEVRVQRLADKPGGSLRGERGNLKGLVLGWLAGW